jgi:hypothetical protein
MRTPSAVLQNMTRVAKKLRHLGLETLSPVLATAEDKRIAAPSRNPSIVGQAAGGNQPKPEYQDIKQLLQQQFPHLSRQVLGSRYKTVQQVSQWLLPNGFEQGLDLALHHLDRLAQQWAATEQVLAQVGEDNLAVLQKDLSRSARASQAFKRQNQRVAQYQGVICGACGLVGAAVDLPLTLLLALKTIYQVGHLYGFELENEEDQQAVYLALRQSDLALMTEKQSILLALTTTHSIVKTGNYQAMQEVLDSHYGAKQWQSFFAAAPAAQALLKKTRLANSKLKYLSPLLGAVVGAYYNHQLIGQVAMQAEQIFADARAYLQNQDLQHISVTEAYYQQQNIHALPHLSFISAEQQATIPYQTPDSTGLKDQPNLPKISAGTPI